MDKEKFVKTGARVETQLRQSLKPIIAELADDDDIDSEMMRRILVGSLAFTLAGLCGAMHVPEEAAIDIVQTAFRLDRQSDWSIN